MKKLPQAFHNHIHFIIIVPLLIIVMTWPTILHVFDTNTFAVPTRNIDVWQKLWDVWHAQQFLAGRTSFYHSEAMFYPLGLSLAFENFSLPHMLAVNALGAFLPPANAFSLTYLLIVFAVALSAYLYCFYLFEDRWLALLGAAVFGFSQHIIAHAAHPDVNLIVSLPLSAYFFQRGIQESRTRYLVYCGITVGFTAFMSIYIFVCVLITLALIVIYFAIERWKEPRYWRWILLLCLVIGLASAGRIAPMLADAGELASALSKNTTQETGTDLLSYFVNYRHPLTTPALKALFQADSPFYSPHTSYLGYLPLALIIIGFFKSGYRRQMLPWLALALPFLLLRLGSVLEIDGQEYSNIILPKSFLDDLLPAIFSPFHAADHFQMGILLPLSVMTCYGIKSILESRPKNQRSIITLAVIALVALEYYETTAARVIPDQQLAFIESLRQENFDRQPRLINLPMGRQPSKLYGFYQTLTGFPQVEGLSGRTPPEAYAYIDGNLLLKAWRRGTGVHCFPPLQSEFISALDQLQNDGFTHIIWHHWLGEDMKIASSFVDVPASYSDDYVTIFRVEDLRQSCDLTTSVNQSALEDLQDLESSSAIIPMGGSAILSLLSNEGPHQVERHNGAAVLFGLHHYTTLVLEEGAVAAPDSSYEDDLGADELLASHSVILLAYDPQTADPDSIRSYRDWLTSAFKSCRRLTETNEAVIEYFLKSAFPCELALAERPLEVHYANGVQLGNLLVERESGLLDLHLLWTRLPLDAQAFSIQFIDAEGARVEGADFVIGLEALDHQRVDAASLPPGDYLVKMILYDYDTGASVAGAVTAEGSSFDRELEIARLTID